MSCLNMQAPQRWSFNIRLYKGASALRSFIPFQSWYSVLLSVVGKRTLPLLCIRLSCTVPLFTALIFSGTSVGPLDTIGRDTIRSNTIFVHRRHRAYTRPISWTPGAALRYTHLRLAPHEILNINDYVGITATSVCHCSTNDRTTLVLSLLLGFTL
jgi:hypothetical protein